MAAKIEDQEALDWAKQWPDVKRWLGRFLDSTRLKYAKSLMKYVRFTELSPPDLLELKNEDNRNSTHEAEKLLDTFVTESPLPASTRSMVSVAVKSFYKWNYMDLSRASGRVATPKNKPYRTPTQHQLKTFVIGANPRDKALILLMAATRVREGTICRLNWSHVWKDLFEEPKDPPHIGILAKDLKGGGQGRYVGLQQHTFLTPDAKKALLEYKNWREDRFKVVVTKDQPLFGHVYDMEGSDRLTTSDVRQIFTRASERTGLTFSPHDLGRFTQTQLEDARLNPNWIKKICGHKVRGEENPYSRPKIERLRKAYDKAIAYLTTEVTYQDQMNQMENKMKERGDEVEKLQIVYQQVLKDNEKLKDAVEVLSTQLKKNDDTIVMITDFFEDVARISNADVQVEHEEKFLDALYRLAQKSQKLSKSAS